MSVKIVRCDGLVAAEDFLHFYAVHLRKARGELVDGMRVFDENGLELHFLSGGDNGGETLNNRHQIIGCVGGVILKCRCPQAVVAFDGVEDVKREIQTCAGDLKIVII